MPSKISRWSGASWTLVDDLDDNGVTSVVGSTYININSSVPSVPVISATGLLPLAGGTMSGRLNFSVGGGEAIRFDTSGPHITWFNDSTLAIRTGYIQGNGEAGMILNSERGSLQLVSAAGYVTLPYSQRIGYVNGTYGASFGGLSWSNGQYLIMSEGSSTFVSTPASSGTLYLRGGINGPYELLISYTGTHQMIGHLNMNNYNVSGVGSFAAGGCTVSSVNSSGSVTMAAQLVVNEGGSFIQRSNAGTSWADMQVVCQNNDSNATGHDVGISFHYPAVGVANIIRYNPWSSVGGLDCVASDNASPVNFTAANIAVPSSVRFKDNVRDIDDDDVLDRLGRLALKRWKSKFKMQTVNGPHDCSRHACAGTHPVDDPCASLRNHEREDVGVTAEDLAEILPELVNLDANGQPEYVMLGGVASTALASVGAVVRRLELLEQRLSQLEAV